MTGVQILRLEGECRVEEHVKGELTNQKQGNTGQLEAME